MIKQEDLLQALSKKFVLPVDEIKQVLHLLQDVMHGSQQSTEEQFPFTSEEEHTFQDETMVDAVHLVVQCRKNDSEDIRMGGPLYLGYVFLIEQEKKEEIKDFVLAEMAKNNQHISPLSGSIFYSKEIQIMKKELTNRTMIQRSIAKGCE